MRVYIKTQLLELIVTLKDMHKILMNLKDIAEINRVLLDCQQAAIVIGENIEQVMPADETIVPLLEDYCEQVYQLSLQKGITEKLLELEKIIAKVEEAIRCVPDTYLIIFMPYKVEMWDSLESIWEVCQQDERCECIVMPLPYFKYNAIENKTEYCYEGELFPEEVPITYYTNYSLETMLPDVGYIHNPYDNGNLVTSIHPEYYSNRLKQYIRKLIYVPYYVTTGFISPEHLELPVYHNMDYMVVQSEYAKNSCKGMYYYDKILPFGSPKIDGVIKECKHSCRIPEEWRSVLKGKKILMLNTSIGGILYYGSYYLEKMKNIFKIMQEHNYVALIWRPHPLLESTIRSMRPQLLEQYTSLVNFYISDKIGIYDQSSDITNIVALADAYIGESGSSVINLFAAAGKPVFILNFNILEKVTYEDKKKIIFTDLVINDEFFWGTTGAYNAIFQLDLEKKMIYYKNRIDNQPKWYGAYPFLTQLNSKLFLSPYQATCPAVYNIIDNEYETVSFPKITYNIQCRKTVAYENKVFYLPGFYNEMIELDTETYTCKYHSQCIKELRGNDTSQEEVTFECEVQREYLWITATYTNRIIQLNMLDGTYRLHLIGDSQNGYSGIVADRDHIWLAEVHSGNILRWNQFTGEIQSYSMPDEFCSWNHISGRQLAHLKLLNFPNYIITIPAFSNGMVRIDKASGKVEMMLKEFFLKAVEDKNGYNHRLSYSSYLGIRLDAFSVLVQRTYDAKMAIVNIENNTYETFDSTLSEQDYNKLTEGEDGFEKLEEKYAFYRCESKVFSLEGFIDDLVNNRLNHVKERQLQELSKAIANLDGTCGQKVHAYIMNELENEK